MVAFELAFTTFSTANEKNSRFEIRHRLDDNLMLHVRYPVEY